MLLRLELLVFLAMVSAGCQVVEGIFKAGMWVGILLVVVVLGDRLHVVRSIRNLSSAVDSRRRLFRRLTLATAIRSTPSLFFSTVPVISNTAASSIDTRS